MTIFALAFATAICFEHAPGKFRLDDQQCMKNHLINCLEKQEFTMFLIKKEHQPRKITTVRDYSTLLHFFHIQMTPSEERFNRGEGLEVPGCWTAVMRRQGGRSNPHQPLTSNDVYPQ